MSGFKYFVKRFLDPVLLGPDGQERILRMALEAQAKASASL
jgi:hypothetical protein